MRTCDTVTKGPFPCMCCRSFEKFKIPTSGGLIMRRLMFYTMVTEGVVYGVFKVVTWLPFGVRRLQVNGDYR